MTMFFTQANIGIIAALVSTLAWAVSGVLFKILGERLDPIGMTAAKTFFSVLLLLPVVLIFYDFSLTWNHFLLIALSGLIGIAVGDTLFFAALSKLSPLLLSIILLVCPDIFSGILGIVFLGEMPSLYTWIGIICILTAMGYLAIHDALQEKQTRSTIIGVALGLLSIICTAVSMTLIKPILQGESVVKVTMFRMLFGFIALVCAGLKNWQLKKWLTSFVASFDYTWKFIAATCLVTYGGFYLSMLSVKHLDIVVASTLMALEPLFIIPAMIILKKHKTDWKEIFFLLLAVAGILIITIFNN